MQASATEREPTRGTRVRQFADLTKPRVTLLAVFCAVIGMFLAAPGMVDPVVLAAGTLGIWLLAGGAFAVNCLIERRIDAQMARTRARPLARGELGARESLVFALILAGVGAALLLAFVNALTMWLTVATFFGYAFVYTVLLKPTTPQNIVIGGLSGAMPPMLGWAAVTGEVGPEAILLVLIIFVWTPPHFWALALYRVEDYRKSGLPMLPVTHGHQFTQLHILLYTVLLTAVSVLPFVIRMSGWPYLVAALVLGAGFVRHAWKLHRSYSDRQARATFGYSLFYLAALFAALLVDHYIELFLAP
ncbi:MAG: protoheme IX farnesyltransferase [Burkholderiales bacterium]|nr:protoheme IX farnesyltransferase [Burkholderiales bacterium]